MTNSDLVALLEDALTGQILDGDKLIAWIAALKSGARLRGEAMIGGTMKRTEAATLTYRYTEQRGQWRGSDSFDYVPVEDCKTIEDALEKALFHLRNMLNASHTNIEVAAAARAFLAEEDEGKP